MEVVKQASFWVFGFEARVHCLQLARSVAMHVTTPPLPQRPQQPRWLQKERRS